MIELKPSCAMCGKEGEPFNVETDNQLGTIPAMLEGRGWIVQFNGGIVDLYCCPVCAE